MIHTRKARSVRVGAGTGSVSAARTCARARIRWPGSLRTTVLLCALVQVGARRALVVLLRHGERSRPTQRRWVPRVLSLRLRLLVLPGGGGAGVGRGVGLVGLELGVGDGEAAGKRSISWERQEDRTKGRGKGGN
ncbi:hypothetical protein B0H16DRAFT_1451357 [Mycena metata]|uniref:Uncharacterized protein n=1 Tax=Mycena metata TaxID=1033252 RepID=A0AAD7JWU8_9AGAR|nr:hypothetical protein B0H16DRAFT_1451357 [Mycena metata]